MNDKLIYSNSQKVVQSILKVLCYLQSEKILVFFYKINTCLQKVTTFTGLQAE